MKYAAFFRGINIGGKNKVKMTDLKQLFLDCGFCEVKTYIQSGNVLFESDKDKYLLSDSISNAFAERFAFRSHVVLRSGNEIAAILSALPFTKEEIQLAEEKDPEVEHVYLFLSNGSIDMATAETLRAAYEGEDKLYIGERELYLLCYHSIRDSRLAGSLAKLDASLTFRNQKTMRKICDLLNTKEFND